MLKVERVMLDKRIAQKWLVFFVALLMATCTFANPVLENVASGNVTIQQSGNTTQVNQASQQAIINWQSFNINANEKMQFVQPNANAVALNRINPTQGASQIYGQLSANGRIILVNQAGIYFGPNARVDVSGLIASTADITDANFLAGKYHFDQASSYNGSVINAGKIVASNNGLVALLGTAVRNDGLIQANLGSIVLGSGRQFTLDLSGDQLINFSVDAASAAAGVDQRGHTVNYGVKNTGGLIANGGRVLISAQTAQSVLNNAINMKGVDVAQSVAQHNGEIILSAGPQGTVKVSGKLNASARSGSHTKGGTIKVLGNTVRLTSSAILKANGQTDGGTILIGGNIQGKGPEQNAQTANVAQGATMSANAGAYGNGGTIVVWSDGDTYARGTFSAMGGSASGNGGFLETSGHVLDVNGIHLNLQAVRGATGTWLLDPYNLYINNNSTTATGTGTSGNPFTSGATDSYLNANALMGYLADANITLQTTNSGSIQVDSALSWSSATTLSLLSAGNIYLNAAINAPAGGLSLSAVNGAQSIIGGTIGSGTIGNAVGTAAYSINVANFILQSGQWFQANTSLPVFNVTNNFSIAAGTTYNGAFNAQFTRINTTSGNGITDVFGLQGIATGPLSTSYQVNNNIDATFTSKWNSGAGFVPIGNSSTNYYSGMFNGQNYTINGLYINLPAKNYVGLIGYAKNATVDNTTLTNVYVSGTTGVGSLVGYALQGLTASYNTYASGSVIGSGNGVGGLLGYLDTSGAHTLSYDVSSGSLTVSGGGAWLGGLVGYFYGTSLSNSYSTGPIYVTGNNANQIGGLVGKSRDGAITNSYSLSPIIITATGVSSVGGFVGYLHDSAAAVSNSYAAGAIVGSATTVGGFVGYNLSGVVSNSFWDQGAVGVANSVGYGSSTGITKSNFTNMTTASTFSGATWNMSSIWGIINNTSYPYLLSFYPSTPRIISGTLPDTGGKTVTLAVNGVNNVATAYTGANGTFNFFLPNNSVADNSAMLIYWSNATSKANIVALAPTSGASIKGLTVGSGNTLYAVNAGLTNTLLGTAIGSLSGSNFLYSVSGTTLNLNNNVNFESDAAYTLDGNMAATGTGAITFNNSVTLSNDAALATASQAINFNGALSGANNLTIAAGSGAVTFGNTVSGLASLTSNTTAGVNINTTSITTLGNQSYAGTITLGSDTNLSGDQITTAAILGGAHLLTITNTGTSSMNGIFSGTGASLVKSGNGSLTLSSANTYTGTTKINAGTLIAGNNTAFSNGALNLNGGALQSNTAVTLANDYSLGANSSISGTQNITLSGNGNLNNKILTMTNTGTTTLSGVVSGTGALAQSAGTLVLNAANTYQGGTTITNGILQLNNDSALGMADVTLSNSTLILNNVSISQNVTLDGVLNSAGTSILNGNLTLTNQAQINVATNSDSLQLNGTINGAFDLTTSGAGVVVFNRRIGNLNPINSLTTNSLVVLNGVNVNSINNQIYNKTVQLTGNNSLDMSSGNIIQFNAAVNGSGSALTISNNSALTATFNDSVNLSQLTAQTSGNAVLNFALNPAALQLNISTETTGSATGNGIAFNYAGINQIIANTNLSNSLQMPNKKNMITITGQGTGYINDPFTFSGFNTLVGISGNDYVVFNVSYALGPTANSVSINGTPLYFTNIPTPFTVSQVTIASTSGITTQQQQQATSLTSLNQSLSTTQTVDNNITTILNNQIEITDNKHNKTTFKINCQ